MNKAVLSFKSYDECPKIVRRALRNLNMSNEVPFSSILFIRRENDVRGDLRSIYVGRGYTEKYDPQTSSYILYKTAQAA